MVKPIVRTDLDSAQNSIDNLEANKVDKVTGKGLSTEDYTSAEKTKLAGVEAGANVNTVDSVSGKTGAVTLNKSDVGLGNVDNTSDLNKPISTTAQVALDGKVDKVEGKGLSTEDYTSAEKVKVANLPEDTNAQLADIVTDVEGIDARVSILETISVKTYGVRRVLDATSSTLQRLGDAVGLVANADSNNVSHNAVVNDFDSIYPWSHMRPCIITDNGKIYYEDEPGYSTAIGDWMIEVPEFYIKHTRDGVNEDIYVSGHQIPGYTKTDKFYVARFKTTELGDASHASRPSTFPKVVMGRTDFRTKAQSKGVGWQLSDLMARYLLVSLYKIEFAELNSQAVLGNGVVSVRYTEDDISQLEELATNRIVLLDANAAYYNVGEAISIGTSRGNMSGGQYRSITAINSLGNGTTELVFDGEPIDMLTTYKAYEAGQVTGKTLDLLAASGSAIGASSRASVSYRGIEDIFGNVWEWVDGCLINDNLGHVCLDPVLYGDAITSDFVPLGYTNHNANGYPGEMGYDEQFPHAQWPINVTGGTSTKYCDYYYQNTGLRAPSVGGTFLNGSFAGLFYWYLLFSPSSARINIGARLMYKA
jgi:hypothetical protein